MATAILPPRDYLSSTYQENQNGRGGMVYSQGRKCYHSKRKLVGGSPEYGKRKLDPQIVTAKSHYVEKQWNILSRSMSFSSVDKVAPGNSTVAVTQSPLTVPSDLPRPSSTPPAFNMHPLCFESISHKAVRTTRERNLAKHPFPNIIQTSVAGRSNAVFSSAPDSRRLSQNKGNDESQAEFGKGPNKNFKAGSVFDKGEIAFKKDGMLDRRTDKKVGKNLVMGQVTILKRGETIKSVTDTDPDSANHQIKRQGRPSRVLKDDTTPNSMATVQPSIPKKNKSVAALKSVPKLSSDDASPKKLAENSEGNDDKPNKLADDLVITSTERLGPDPSVLPKEGSGILRSVSTGVSVSEIVEDYMSKLLPSFGSGNSLEGMGYLKVGSDDDTKAPPILAFESEKWSGPAFSNSPPPSCLPLPKFSVRQNAPWCWKQHVPESYGLNIDHLKRLCRAGICCTQQPYLLFDRRKRYVI